MKPSLTSGIGSILFGSALLGVLVYEPAEIVTRLGINGRLDEASVVLGGLLLVATCVAMGIAGLRGALRRARA